MYISGAIGLTILKENDASKYYFVFHDDHSNTEYCEKQIFIDDIILFLLKKKVKFSSFIEEPYSSYSNIRQLWQGTYHVTKFTKFSKELKQLKLENVHYTDIRYNILPIEFDLILPEKYNKMQIKDFFKILLNFHNTGFLFIESLTPEFVKFLKQQQNHPLILHIIQEIKRAFNDVNLDENVSTILNENFVITITNILDNIMEFFTYFNIIHSTAKINILYYGLKHSYLLCNLLLTNCKLIYHAGFNFKQVNMDELSSLPSCVRIIHPKFSE